ncbi:MAG: hypothetical protein WCF04_00460, partial [Candidatus Nanopelagicales bacterium]
PDPWLAPEWGTTACGVLVAAAFVGLAGGASLAMPLALEWPQPGAVPALAILLAAGPAWWTPRPPDSAVMA